MSEKENIDSDSSLRSGERVNASSVTKAIDGIVDVVCENLANNMTIKDRLINISSSGVLLFSCNEIQRDVGTKVNLKIDITGEIINVEGEIVRKVKKDGGIQYGIKFLNLDHDYKVLIEVISCSEDTFIEFEMC